MARDPFETAVEQFWDDCDVWVQQRCEEPAVQAARLSETEIEKIQADIEQDLNDLIEQGVETCGERFAPHLLLDLHHLFFELALKDCGVDNQDHVHRYKDNAQVGISMIEGSLTPDNAGLLLQLNRSHQEKKGGDDTAACEDCICGRR